MMIANVEKQHSGLFKSFAIILGTVLLFGMLFSAFFITTELHHDCSGEDCPICQMIAVCENFVSNLGTGLIFLAVALLLVLNNSYLSIDSGASFIAPTLVRQKVRLNN